MKLIWLTDIHVNILVTSCHKLVINDNLKLSAQHTKPAQIYFQRICGIPS